MDKYKFYYYDGRGNGELCRILLAYGHFEYEDKRFPKEGSPDLKSFLRKAPMRQLPVLEKDGDMLCKAPVIARYLAEILNLAGQTTWQQAKVSMHVQATFDLYKDLKSVEDATGKPRAIAWKKFQDEFLKPFLENYNKLITEDKCTWLVGDEITYADLAVAEILSLLADCYDPDVLSDNDNLEAYVKRVFDDPNIKDSLEQVELIGAITPSPYDVTFAARTKEVIHKVFKTEDILITGEIFPGFL
ncbi:unnamed protein product [Soboliphyme baturini]|uniref:Glutathione transferase n=1 Tax=Soboliphyme baturini TaxID=241478 RepID=A0A183J2I1_9BILA|nr:unnamed protein product [Soboliphyme baturini]